MKIRYTTGGIEYRTSLSSLLTQGHVPSTRMMKYLIALTEILIEARIVDAKKLSKLASAYEVNVEVHEIELIKTSSTIDVTPKKITDGKS